MERKESGFEKVLTAYRKQVNFTDELKPTYTSSATWFKAVLPNLNYQLSATVEIKILELIRITQREMAQITGLIR